MTIAPGYVPVSSEAELRGLLGEPPQRATLTKERARLHQRDREWLAASPFCLIATADACGHCDVSPKGDPPGFTHVIDDTHDRDPGTGPATAAPTASATSWPTRTPGRSSLCTG